MKQFHLNEWLKDKSRKIVNSDGFPVRIVCHDRKGTDYSIIYLVDRGNAEYYGICDKDGYPYMSGNISIWFAD